MNQPMHNRYSDSEELRPTGKAPHTPDQRLNDGCEGVPRRQRIAASSGGYPDVPTVADGECQPCGTSVPDGQTKCRFCLVDHLGSDTTSMNESTSTTHPDIVHLVAESTTFYGTVAKGSIAAKFLSANEAELAIDSYTLICDLDEAPARQLAEQWPSLPDVIQVSSEEGEGLLSTVCDRAGWYGQEAPERREQAPTRLYDQWGNGIRDLSCLTEILGDADDTVWLTPTITLNEFTGGTAADHQVSSVSTTQELDCQNCGRAIDHRFKTHESVPDEAWTGQPIWECRICDLARYGPSPKQPQC